jgi:protease-4
VSLLHEQLSAAADDDRVKAVILRLNTPGGTVTASDAMYRLVERFKAATHKPVVAFMMDVTASGGYYLACAADQIMACPTTVTGSIGVIVQTISFKPAMSRFGIEAEAIASGPNKEAGSPLSTLTDENRVVLRAMVDDFYERFLSVVRKSRKNIPADQFAAVTDGRVVTGGRAAELGLVDRLGDLHDAVELAKEMGGVARADLVRYHRPFQYVGSPYAAAPNPVPHAAPGPGGTVVNLAQFNFSADYADAPTMFYYLWQLP